MNDATVFFDERMLVGECPLWEPNEGALYWIDIEGRSVHQYVERTDQHRMWSLPSEPGCIGRAKDGLVVALRTGIFILDTSSGKLVQLARAPFNGMEQRFNDGRCDLVGRLWVGTIHEPRDGPKGSLYRFDGKQLLDVHLPVTVSNGLAFSPDSRTLYHADTTAHCIRAYDFDLKKGHVTGAGRVLRSFSTLRDSSYSGRPDGAAVDVEGAYWVAMFEGGMILRLSPQGETLGEFKLPVRCPTMVAFGGSDMQTLFITTASYNRSASELQDLPDSGKVLQLRVAVPGPAEPVFQH